MKIYDISKEIFSTDVFPGDPLPECERILSISNGDICNVTKFSMCAHNATHIDAPFHFIEDGKRTDEIDIETLVGKCYVYEHSGDITAKDVSEIITRAKSADAESALRIIIKGNAVLSAEAARILVTEKICLIGSESQTIGPEDAPAEVHKILLSKDIVLLECLSLTDVPEGVYILSAAPLKFAGFDGAPCRAVLIKP